MDVDASCYLHIAAFWVSKKSHPIPNPNIYLNYLEPNVASEYEIARDVFLVTCHNHNHNRYLDHVIRTCALAAAFVSALATTGLIQNCSIMPLTLSLFWVLASGSSSYLFLKRVHAVFLEEGLVRHAFTALWIAGVGASTVILPGLLHDYYQIANTKHCINVKIKNHMAAAFIVSVFFDALVLFATTYKILKFHRAKKPASWGAFCCAEALPRLSRAVLQGVQQYYMFTIGVNVTRSIVVLSPNVSPTLQLLPLVPAVALTSVMACRVFRNLMSEVLQETETRNLTTIRFADREPVSIHLSKTTDVLSWGANLEQCWW